MDHFDFRNRRTRFRRDVLSSTGGLSRDRDSGNHFELQSNLVLTNSRKPSKLVFVITTVT
jgi:hypothetical protein